MYLVYAFISAIAASAVAILAKFGLRSIDSTLATTVRSLVMAAFLVIVSLSLKKFEGFNFHSLSAKDWILIIVTKVAVIDKLSVVFVILFATIFLGEALTWKVGLGALLIASGAALIALK
jgi:bacterial/archaeal transporter family protein